MGAKVGRRVDVWIIHLYFLVSSLNMNGQLEKMQLLVFRTGSLQKFPMDPSKPNQDDHISNGKTKLIALGFWNPGAPPAQMEPYL